ncbi:hypothetical protein MBLNU459_g6295t2 [Dothideomycetes sp. NU459]
MSKSTNQSAATEVTPLLAVSSEAPLAQANEEILIASEIGRDDTKATGSDENDEGVDDEKPLPLGQIAALCYCSLVAPMAFFSIFPFISKMIQETGDIAETDVGFYAGLIESLFSLTQMTLMISWGRASDRFGRKPVLVVSLFGVAVSSSLFGLSKTVWQMILFRCFAGIFSGTVVTIRSMVQEHSTPATQARAFSLLSFAGNLGIFIGPVVGGALSNPAEQYPGAFGNVQFLVDYPYALPSLVTGLFGLSSGLISLFYIKETLATKETGKSGSEPPMTTWEVVKSPGVPPVLLLYCSISLLALAYTAVIPVFWFTSVPLGGFNLSPIQISLLLGLGGISQAVWMLLAFPPLHRRWGTAKLLRIAFYVWPILFVFSPVANLFLKHGWTAGFYTLVPVAIVIGSGVAMAFTGVQLALNNISPTPAVLGTLNAVALALTCGIRAVTPAAFAIDTVMGNDEDVTAGVCVPQSPSAEQSSPISSPRATHPSPLHYTSNLQPADVRGRPRDRCCHHASSSDKQDNPLRTARRDLTSKPLSHTLILILILTPPPISPIRYPFACTQPSRQSNRLTPRDARRPTDPQVFHLTPLSFCLVNLKPLLPGHVLVSPLRRVPHLDELTGAEVADLFGTVQRVARTLKRVYGAGALNIAIQDGAAAGQSVPHVHAHVIPRHDRDMEGRGGGDKIYELLEGEEGNVGGHLREREGEGEPEGRRGGRFPKVEDSERKPRSMEAMQEEAEWLAREMEKDGDA